MFSRVSIFYKLAYTCNLLAYTELGSTKIMNDITDPPYYTNIYLCIISPKAINSSGYSSTFGSLTALKSAPLD